MDQILGVVHHDHLEPHRALPLIGQHALVDPVEAIGLGGGAVVRAERQMHLRKARLGLADGCDGGAVVRIGAGEDGVVPVLESAYVVLDHFADDTMLAPQRDEDGSGLLPNGPGRRDCRRRAAEPGGEGHQVEQEIVQPAQQDPDRKPRQAKNNDPIDSRQGRFLSREGSAPAAEKIAAGRRIAPSATAIGTSRETARARSGPEEPSFA